ncbi:MAG: DUF192 domain-containing protein [Candidatus Nitricoxidivorans perseverans]|uniref:DUF192 domain-containing protein n=1 Tax=Candidatus Nitricoxidivorans perseverans TaxID=2975601 RepID=A0AA49IXI4_9PROT|nr:MAG: DUF192 domain-containing protein [Candidatus Nitricoxidivorans perseverans]
MKFPAGLLAVAAFIAPPALAQAVVELNAGIHRIEAEVANTHDARMTGLMHRKSMGVQRGMLFVFDAPSPQCMWMRNTLIPLSVAFLDEQGRIINVEEMRPRTEINHCAARPAKYALEMNAGWFRQRGLKAGDAIGAVDRAPPAR